jgi:hypothetical protein
LVAGQGDSEILLVQDETVYYRVFDAIYKAAIIDGKSLGEPELLVKDGQIVPQIHWAFLKKENKGQFGKWTSKRTNSFDGKTFAFETHP